MSVRSSPSRVRAGAQPRRASPCPAVEVSVADLTFQGPVVRTALRTDAGADLVAHIGPEDDLPMLRPGDRLWASWDLDAACLLRAAHTNTTAE